MGALVRAGASNREMATAMGVDITRLFTIVFGIGAALCAVAGALLGPLLAVQVGMGENILILAFVVIVIGGIGSIRGALVGAHARRRGRHARPHAAAARAARVPAAAVGERRRPGARLDRGLRLHGGGAGDPAAGPVPGARLMAARPAAHASRSPPARSSALALPWLLRALGARLLPQPGEPDRRLRDRRDQPQPRPRLRRHGLVRPRRVRRPRRLRDRRCWSARACSAAALHLAATIARHRASPRSSIGAISLRTRGVYFIMITLAFAQMLFYLANSVKGYGGDEGLNIRARSLFSFGGWSST